MSTIEKIMLTPILLLIGAGLIGVGALLYSFIIEDPLLNGLVVIFSFWLSLSIIYCMTRNQ